MRIARIAAIGAGTAAAVFGAKKLKQARSSKNRKGALPTDASDLAEEGDAFLDPSTESL